jgi:REP element-mobilizing transposase RayT
MARPLRLSYPGAVYYGTVRGNDRQTIVRDKADWQRVVRTLAAMVEPYQVLCHAWVLMENHYPLVLETPQAHLSHALRHLTCSAALLFVRMAHATAFRSARVRISCGLM